MKPLLFFLIFVFSAIHPCDAAEEPEIRSAIEKSLPLLNSAATGSAEHRKCYTCHGQGLPILAFLEAKELGFAIDEENLKRQVAHTVAHLTAGKDNYLNGTGQGGKADMAGSALWAIKAAGSPRTEITDAVAGFLVKRNADTPHWTASAVRPPAEGSKYTSTFLALKGLEAYGTEGDRKYIENRKEAAQIWLAATTPNTTEDYVFRLLALQVAGAEQPLLDTAGRELNQLQRDDGGWGQMRDLESDAYATGSALVSLFDTYRTGRDSNIYQRGITYLLKTQLPDGSWHIATRASPIQKYYESGFPHGADQFISATGTAWATMALLRALPGTDLSSEGNR